MGKNNSPSSKRYQKRRMRERNAAGRVALPVLKANWPELFAASLPFVDSITDELYTAAISRGIALPREVIKMAVIAHARKSSYKKRMKKAGALAGLGYIVPLTPEEREQRYATYKAMFFNFGDQASKTPLPAKPVF